MTPDTIHIIEMRLHKRSKEWETQGTGGYYESRSAAQTLVDDINGGTVWEARVASFKRVPDLLPLAGYVSHFGLIRCIHCNADPAPTAEAVKHARGCTLGMGM